jgi:hypothetical protein
MSHRPDAADILGMARIAGVPIDQPTAERIARSIGPACENFAPGALPFDCEPASFAAEQTKGADR